MAPADDIRVSLTEFTKIVAREAAREVIERHIVDCPQVLKIQENARLIQTNAGIVEKNAEAITTLRIRWAVLAGMMLGSGLLGGAAGSVLVKLL